MTRRSYKPPYGKRAARADPAAYAHVFAASEPFEEVAHLGDRDWFLIRDVPLAHLQPQTLSSWSEDPDLSEAEVAENEARYEEIARLLDNGEEVWPVLVSKAGRILDGYHRLAVLNDRGAPTVDVLWARSRRGARTRGRR